MSSLTAHQDGRGKQQWPICQDRSSFWRRLFLLSMISRAYYEKNSRLTIPILCYGGSTMLDFFHSILGKVAVGISTILIGFAGFISPSPKIELAQIPIATSTTEVTVATTTKTVAPATTKVVETPAPKKVAPASISIKIAPPISPAPADSQLLTVEKCKAKRDITRGILWSSTLDAVQLAEQRNQQSRLNVLAPSYQGTVSARDFMNMVKI